HRRAQHLGDRSEQQRLVERGQLDATAAARGEHAVGLGVAGLERALVDCGEDLFLVAVLPIDQRARHARALRDVLERRLAVAVLEEARARRLEQHRATLEVALGRADGVDGRHATVVTFYTYFVNS